MSLFNNVVIPKVRKSFHNLSYENKLSFDMGDLVPVYTENVVPGDRFRVNTEVFLRFAPMLAPIMHRVNCYVHYFFVPYRLIWDDWKDFITGGEDGLLQPVFPKYRLFGKYCAPGQLGDFLGYNFSTDLSSETTSKSGGEYSLLDFRAYQLIYNEYYRDQNLTPAVQFSKASGNSQSTDVLISGTDYDSLSADIALAELMTLRKRAWEKDYFTSALPFVQRGVAAQIPFGDPSISGSGISNIYQIQNSEDYQVAVKNGSTSDDLDFDPNNVIPNYEITSGGSIVRNGSRAILAQQGQPNRINLNGSHGVSVNDIASKLQLDGLTAPTINELRLSNHIQKWLEINARVGSRYIEQILGHYGVRVPDYRLDRPEYLGGGKSPVQISEVLQTSSTDDITPQGNMSGHAYAVGNKNKFKYTFDEHGIVLGIMSVLPRTSYQQGMSRFHTKFDKFDHYFPEFAHLGEQDIKEEELWCSYAAANQETNKSTFGYQERYAEYKYRSSEVHGDFRTSLDFWHLGRKFENKPELNTSFVESNPSKRIWAVQDGAHLWCYAYNSVASVRPIPKHSIPSL